MVRAVVPRKTRPKRASARKSAAPALSRAAGSDIRIDIDLDEARREAARIADWLQAFRRRYDLTPFEYTRHVRIVPASKTYSHPILTLGTRFTETEDQLLGTYLHEQMHWYLYLLGGIDHDPIAPFFDELVRRYPDAPTTLPEGARNYDQTYAHLVVCWLELAATTSLIGRKRALALADTTYGYRWIYRTVVADWLPLEALLTKHGIAPIIPAPVLLSGGARKTVSTAAPPPSRTGRRKPPARGGRSAG